MRVVVDASFAIEAYLESGGSRLASLRHEETLSPSIYVDECRNVIITKVRSGVVDRQAGQRALNDVLFLPDQIGAAVTELVFDLALDHGLSGYDASYLALAVERGDAVATLDKQLQRAAIDLGLVVFS
jgi:predicted nucleic acid-binding protein